ncbi:MAG TPA: SH3 domain-containing protein [Acidimicrobiales bacterium]|jgi:uncharacterized protein YgiM (DUF1202 family)|nr:SH3 domain-containing protein [Acidimicrobiales bacterium]
MRRSGRALVALALALGLAATAGCTGGGPSSSGTTTTASRAPAAGGGSSTTGASQTSGVRTILSPIGLNVRSMPSATAPVLGSAAQGATLNVLGHTDQGGGWYQVMGATVRSGYITDNPLDSAAGTFMAYSDDASNFSVLYPSKWTATAVPPDGVVFHSPSGGDSILVTAAAKVSQLAQDQLGYHRDTATTQVVCGVTGQVVTYTQSTTSATTLAALPGGTVAERYLIQIDLTLDPTHAVGVDAFLSDLSQAGPADDVISSLSFPVPQCQGGAASGSGPTTSTLLPTTVT